MAVDVGRVGGPGLQFVCRHAHLESRHQLGMVGSQLGGDVAQHLQGGALLGQLGLAQGVAQFHHRGRLDEQRALAGGLVVHDACGSVAIVSSDGDHVAAAPDGDRSTFIAHRAQQRLELLDQAPASLVDCLAGRGQCRTSAVEQPPVVVHRDVQLPCQRGVREGLQQRRHAGRLIAHPAQLGGR